MFKDFKAFISKGNIIDLAVAVVMAGAFGKIVSSLVNDILMPLIGIILGGVNFRNLTWEVGDSMIYYGLFIQNIVDFVIIGFTIFMAIKFINNFQKKQPKEKPKKPDDVILLEEIRDLLKKKK